MKHTRGAVIALILGIGLAAAAQAHGINRQGTMSSPNMQSGSTQQMQQGTKRVAVRHKIGKSRHAMALTKKHTRTAALSRKRTHMARLHQRGGQTGTQPVGVGSSNPNLQMTPQTNQLPNSAGGNSITGQTPTTTQPQNQ